MGLGHQLAESSKARVPGLCESPRLGKVEAEYKQRRDC